VALEPGADMHRSGKWGAPRRKEEGKAKFRSEGAGRQCDRNEGLGKKAGGGSRKSRGGGVTAEYRGHFCFLHFKRGKDAPVMGYGPLGKFLEQEGVGNQRLQGGKSKGSDEAANVC